MWKTDGWNLIFKKGREESLCGEKMNIKVYNILLLE